MKHKRKNPFLESVGLALAQGAGVGLGFLGAKKMLKMNPKWQIDRRKESIKSLLRTYRSGDIVTPDQGLALLRRDYKEGALTATGYRWAINEVLKKKHHRMKYLNPLTSVHPEALESLKRYKDDLKAGHTSAAEYWRGQAGAYFTANPTMTAKEFYHSEWYELYDHYNYLNDNLIVLRDRRGEPIKTVTSSWLARLHKIEDMESLHGRKEMRPDLNIKPKPKTLRYRNPTPEKGSPVTVAGKGMFFAGRTLYPSKAKMIREEMREQGINPVLKPTRYGGTMIYTSQRTYPDLSEPMWNPVGLTALPFRMKTLTFAEYFKGILGRASIPAYKALHKKTGTYRLIVKDLDEEDAIKVLTSYRESNPSQRWHRSRLSKIRKQTRGFTSEREIGI